MKSCRTLIDTIISQYSIWLPILDTKNQTIATIIEQELKQFAKTLGQGQKILDKYIADLNESKILGGEQIFMLYDTFGFPVELTEEIAHKQGVKLDKPGFIKAMEQAKEKSRANTLQGHTKNIDWSVHTAGLTPTTFIGYDQFVSESTLLKTIDFEDHKVLIFDQTPFYATMGGQMHDIGTIELEKENILTVFDVQQYNGVFLHFVR